MVKAIDRTQLFEDEGTNDNVTGNWSSYKGNLFYENCIEKSNCNKIVLEKLHFKKSMQ